MVEEEEEEEVSTSAELIIVDIDFKERSIEITPDNSTRSNTTISTYCQTENQERMIAEIKVSIGEMKG